MLEDNIELDNTVYDEIWIIGDKEIPPTPWEPNITVRYRFNINTATAIDFMAINDVTLEIGERLVIARERQNGFNSVDEFWNLIYSYVDGRENL